MKKSVKVKAITTVVCLIFSIAALYTFIFTLDVSNGWRIFLIFLAVSWIISGILNLCGFFRK